MFLLLCLHYPYTCDPWKKTRNRGPHHNSKGPFSNGPTGPKENSLFHLRVKWNHGHSQADEFCNIALGASVNKAWLPCFRIQTPSWRMIRFKQIQTTFSFRLFLKMFIFNFVNKGGSKCNLNINLLNMHLICGRKRALPSFSKQLVRNHKNPPPPPHTHYSWNKPEKISTT